MNYISIGISILALVVSGLTFYFMRVHRGKVKITKPMIIYFGHEEEAKCKKIFLRMLLYSTSESGHYVENMYVILTEGKKAARFSIWAYDEGGRLVRGSGIYINKKGLAFNHHFIQPKEDDDYHFSGGEVKVAIFIEYVGGKKDSAWDCKLNLAKTDAYKINSDFRTGAMFDWSPDEQKYQCSIRHSL